MERLKAILVKQYIGAIATGYIVGRGVESGFAGIMPAVNLILAEALGNPRQSETIWSNVLFSFFSNFLLAGMYFLVACIFALWLYSDRVKGAGSK